MTAKVLTFRDGEHTVAVRTADPRVREIARQLFPDYLDDSSAGASVAHVIDVTAAGSRFEVRGPVGEPSARLEEWGATDELERRLASALLAGRAGSFHLHAAGLAGDAGAILILGVSGAGKSTIGFQWLLSGRPLLGDDLVTIDQRGRVCDFRRWVKVDATRVRRAGLRPEDTVLWRAGYDECWIDPRTLGGWGRTMPVAAIVRVRYDPAQRSSLEAVPASTGLSWLLDGDMGTGVPPRNAFPWLAEAAERAPSFNLVYEDAAEAVSGLRSLLQPVSTR